MKSEVCRVGSYIRILDILGPCRQGFTMYIFHQQIKILFCCPPPSFLSDRRLRRFAAAWFFSFLWLMCSIILPYLGIMETIEPIIVARDRIPPNTEHIEMIVTVWAINTSHDSQQNANRTIYRRKKNISSVTSLYDENYVNDEKRQ